MQVRVRLFAILREQATDRCVLELPDRATVEDAWGQLIARYPALAQQRAWVRAARNGAHAAWADRLGDGDELAFLPPVSGGAGIIELTTEQIDTAALERSVAGSEHGALIMFIGRARDHADDGRSVVELEYEAYTEMAESVLREIAAEAESSTGARVAVVHRLGVVPIGEAAVVIASAAAHRAEAYDASRQVIEAIKQRLPVWKLERFADGSEWKRPGA